MSWADTNMLREHLQTAVQLLYPPRCLGCGDMVDSDFGLCGTCWRDTSFISGVVCESCGVPLPGQSDGFRIECDDCMTTKRPWTEGRAALLYEDRARRLILALKHGDRPEIAKPAALWMARAARPILKDGLLIAPVPLHWSRFVKRRYNQSALLAQELSNVAGLEYCPDLLHRTRRTPSLDGKSAVERVRTLDRAITVHPKRTSLMAGRGVLLVDDVMTSGATLTACTNACLEAGATEVRVLVLARVAKEP